MDDHWTHHSAHQDEPSISELSQHSENLRSYHHKHLASEEAMPLILAPRTKYRTLAYLLSEISLGDLLYNLAIFNCTTFFALLTCTTFVLHVHADEWPMDGIFRRCEVPWYAMYRFAFEIFSFQTFAFATAYLARFIHGIRNAASDDDTDDFGYRTPQQEQSEWCWILWMAAMTFNFLLVWVLEVAQRWQHRWETMDPC